jgi:hypothetical protein
VVEFNATTPASGNNTLNIFDDGHGHLRFNTTSTTGTTTALPAALGPVIHEIVYNASGGTDTLTYNMLNNATLQEDMHIVVALPRGGNKGFTLTMGIPRKNVVPSSPGVPAVPPVPAKPVNISGHVQIDITGSPRPDNVTLSYAGVLTDRLDAFFRDSGIPRQKHPHAADGDKISYTFTMSPNSTGKIDPGIRGGPGDDSLTLFVYGTHKSPRLRVLGRPQINGGGGINTGLSVLPVIMVNTQQ